MAAEPDPVVLVDHNPGWVRAYEVAAEELAAAFQPWERRLAQEHSHDLGAYTDGKTGFVQAVERQARPTGPQPAPP